MNILVQTDIVAPCLDEPSAAVLARSVSYSFGIGAARKQVLFDIDFEMRRGEFVIFTGPSGAGKTTFLTLIGALRSLQAGRLSVFGTQLAGLSASGLRDIRRRTGFIFQDHNLFDALTVFQTLSLTMELTDQRLEEHQAHSRIMEILQSLNMSDYLSAKPQQLSVGQQQRVAVARALINRPRMVLADEPTASLDSDNAQLVINLLRRLVETGEASVLMVTHDTRIFHAADRVINMVDGRIASVS